MKFFKNKKGFTLVELVVVIAILGILAGIAIPRFMDATASARGSKIVADMRTIESAESMNYAKNGSYVDLSGLVTNGFLAAPPVPPSGSYIIPESGKTGTVSGTSYSVVVTAASGTTPASVAVTLDSKSLATLLSKS
ncbi:MAG: competence type IV pilus major pilin ComGC [Acidaminococcaceae bacterium]